MMQNYNVFDQQMSLVSFPLQLISNHFLRWEANLRQVFNGVNGKTQYFSKNILIILSILSTQID